MKKILFVAHERKLGGASQSLITLVKMLKSDGYDPIVVVPLRNCPVAKALKSIEIETIPIFMPWWQMPNDWNLILKGCFRVFYAFESIQVFRCWYKLREIDIDVVHSNSSVIDFGARLAAKMRCKHVWHFREFGDADYNLELLVDKKKMWNRINKESDKIIFISQSLKNYFNNYVDDKKALVIYNGISTDYMIRKEYVKKQIITFLIAGNLHRGKGQSLVLRAISILLERGVENFQVLIAGTTSSIKDSHKYSMELLDYIKSHNLEKKVCMLGKVEDMPALRKKTDVEIVASSKEAFGRVTVEAMMAGMPVVASDSGANTELISSYWNGILFRRESAFELADAMEYLIHNPKEIERMGLHGQKLAMSHFTADINTSQIERLYENL